MLDAIIELVARVDVVLYFVCGLGILIGLRSLSIGRQLRREAVFGLEKEAARHVSRRGWSTIGSMVALAGSVYIVANVVRPVMEGMPASPIGPKGKGADTTLTPAPDAAGGGATPTPRPLLFPTVTPTFGIAEPGGEAAAEPPPTPGGSTASEGCELIGATITNPIPGEVVAGQVDMLGEANILNFQAYKFEINGPSTGGAWATLGTFTRPVASGFLGTWDATSLDPGQYFLRLVVVNSEGNFPEPCVIPITISERAPVGLTATAAP